jgi:hypothetical protein
MDTGHTAFKNSQSVNIYDMHEKRFMTFIRLFNTLAIWMLNDHYVVCALRPILTFSERNCCTIMQSRNCGLAIKMDEM